jgi:hypothetical protein
VATSCVATAAGQLGIAADATRFVARQPSRHVLCDRTSQFAKLSGRAAPVNACSVIPPKDHRESET